MDIEILKSIYWAVVYLNIPLMFLSFFLAITLLKRSENKVYLYFGLTILFLGVWLAQIVLFFLGILPLRNTYVDLSYFFATWIIYFFLMFTYSYPLNSLRNKIIIVLLPIIPLIVSLSTFIPGLYARKIYGEVPLLYVDINPLGIILFSLYFLFCIILSFYNLFTKYYKFGGTYKDQIKKLIIVIGFALVINFFFANLIYLYIHFDTTPIGSLSTFGALAYVYYVVFKK